MDESLSMVGQARLGPKKDKIFCVNRLCRQPAVATVEILIDRFRVTLAADMHVRQDGVLVRRAERAHSRSGPAYQLRAGRRKHQDETGDDVDISDILPDQMAGVSYMNYSLKIKPLKFYCPACKRYSIITDRTVEL